MIEFEFESRRVISTIVDAIDSFGIIGDTNDISNEFPSWESDSGTKTTPIWFEFSSTIFTILGFPLFWLCAEIVNPIEGAEELLIGVGEFWCGLFGELIGFDDGPIIS